MKSITFPEATNTIAENQDEFNTVHSQWQPDDQSINLCFELSNEEIQQIIKTKKIWYKQITGGQPMRPIRLSVFKDEMIVEVKQSVEAGIVVDNYKLKKFKHELEKGGFPTFTVHEFTKDTSTIKVTTESENIGLLKELITEIQTYFQIKKN